MELNIKFDEKLMVETANRVLDEFEYNGKTIREWANLIANPKTNADRIRAMTDEELAEWLEGIRLCCATDLCGEDCPLTEVCHYDADTPTETLDWLKEEATP